MHVGYPVPGRIIVNTNQVPVEYNLRVLIDGRVVGTFPFAANPLGDQSIKAAYKNHQSSRYAHVRVLGLVGKHNALLWAQNTDHNWRNVYENNPIPVVTRARTVVHDLEPGKYRIEYIDTTTDAVFRVDRVRSTKTGGLPLAFPDLATDFAVRILSD